MNISAKTDLINNTNWYHTFEIIPGIWTNGSRGYKVVPSDRLDLSGVPKNLTNKTVIDVGAFDGMYTIELCKRGGNVYSLDIQDPESTAFNNAMKIAEVSPTYIQSSVYELPYLDLPRFDYVLFFGVFYHLKHPVLALRRIYEQLHNGGKMFFDGTVLDDLDKRIPEMHSHMAAIELMRDNPICWYGDVRKVGQNWFFPNVTCLREWMSSSGFMDIYVKYYEEGSAVIGNASKPINESIPIEHKLSSENAVPNLPDYYKHKY